MTIDLFGFQQEDVDKLQDVKSALIANDMGTGKTYEAIARDRIIRDASPLWEGRGTLVVAPLSVLSSWEEHFASLTGLKVVRINPKNREASFRDFLAHGDVFLVHWEALRLMPELTQGQWLHIVADECHKAKNRKAQQTRAFKKIKGTWKTAMSGTPVVNRPDELWSILNWLYSSNFTSYWKFYNRYVEFDIQYPQGYHKVTGPKNVTELQDTLASFMVRRRKEDVLPDLPDKYYTSIYVDLEPKQRRAYDAMKADMVAWIGEHEGEPLVAPVVIAQLTRLQQFAAAFMEEFGDGYRMAEPSSKLDALMEVINDTAGQIVVFSQFKQIARLLSRRLETSKIPFTLLTGDVPQATRGENIQRFQSGGAQVLVGTIAAGGVGVTLTAASTVVFVDRSWSPALNLQAEDRLHRIGQENAVQVIDLMARDTVDLGRKQKLEQKWSWIRALLGDV